MLLLAGLEGLAIVYFLKAFEPSKADMLAGHAFDSSTLTPSVSEGVFSVLARQVLAFGSAAIFIGIAFKLQFWEGAVIMLPIGIGMLLLAIAWQSSTVV